MAKVFPLNPLHPERLCWGCDHYCQASDMRCGNGQSRTQHPAELLGDDWYEHGDWGLDVSPGDKCVKSVKSGSGSPSGQARHTAPGVPR